MCCRHPQRQPWRGQAGCLPGQPRLQVGAACRQQHGSIHTSTATAASRAAALASSRKARPHMCCGRCCCWRCAAPPLCRQAEVLVLAESLIELMDGGRDDAICFPDFLQVRALPWCTLWSCCGCAVVVLPCCFPGGVLASPCGSAFSLAPPGSNPCSNRAYTIPCTRVPCSVMTSFWHAPWQTCSPPASAVGRRAAWCSCSALLDNTRMHYEHTLSVNANVERLTLLTCHLM